MDKQVDKLLTKYKPNANLELEIRLHGNIDIDKLYKGIHSDALFTNHQIECTVNVISQGVYEKQDNKTKYIHLFNYVNNQPTVSYTKKTSVGFVNIQESNYGPYKISLSEELRSKAFKTSDNAFVRFKLRHSSLFELGSQLWRLDITAVKEGPLQSMGAQLASYRQAFCEGCTVDNFLARCKSTPSKIEVEIELMKTTTLITSQSIDDMMQKIIPMTGQVGLSDFALSKEFMLLGRQLSNQRCKSTCSLKLLLSAAEQLSKRTYLSIYPPIGYWLTEKIDGEHCILWGNKLLFSNKMLTLPTTNNPKIVAECEYREGYIFIIDVLQYNDILLDLGFNDRKLVFGQLVKDYEGSVNPTKVIPKDYVQLAEATLKESFTKVYNKTYPYPTDGLILISGTDPYYKTKTYKWKPYEDNTIDFLAVLCPANLLNKAPYMIREGQTLYLLFVQINDDLRKQLGIGYLQCYDDLFPKVDPVYYPIQFSPSSYPLAYLFYYKDQSIDRKVIELNRVGPSTNLFETDWQLVKIRDDKTTGNDFRIAENVFTNFVDVFDFKDLYSEKKIYFNKSRSDSHKAETIAKRIVIGLLFKELFSYANWIIDEAGGRGADLPRWKGINVNNVLFIEIDASAIAELLSRKYAKDKRGGNGKELKVKAYDKIWDYSYDKTIIKKQQALTIHTLVADLKTDYPDLIANIRQYGVATGGIDGISCMFALHYMCDNMANLRNVLTFNHKMLKTKGNFVFTVMDGKKVFDMLKGIDKGQAWEVSEHNVVKYRIRKLYNSDSLQNTGQMISVLLPMDDNEKEEPLCNINYVIDLAKTIGFRLVRYDSMWSYETEIRQAAHNIYNQLSDNDKQYISLYSYVILEKV